MKTRLGNAFAAIVLSALAACSSTPDNRIKDHQATFNSLSPEDQGKIRGGRVDVGFTPEMVILALGEPDRKYVRSTAQGTSEIWAYRNRSSGFSLGLGVGGGGTAVGVGVHGGDRGDDRARIVFTNGRVSAIERRGR